MGEVAPTYFASTDARERIAQVAPSAKIVCIFRNPVERVLSLYRLKRAYGMSRWNFEEAVFKDPELVESGRYATHLKAWRATFGKDRVIAMVYDDLRRDPQGYVNKISEFIGIPRFALSPDLRRTHESEDLTHPRVYFLTRAAHQIADWFKAERLDGLVAVAKRRILLKFLLRSGRKFEALSPKIAGSVYEIFRAEVEELESLLNRDFSSWKPQVVSANVLQAA